MKTKVDYRLNRTEQEWKEKVQHLLWEAPQEWVSADEPEDMFEGWKIKFIKAMHENWFCKSERDDTYEGRLEWLKRNGIWPLQPDQLRSLKHNYPKSRD